MPHPPTPPRPPPLVSEPRNMGVHNLQGFRYSISEHTFDTYGVDILKRSEKVLWHNGRCWYGFTWYHLVSLGLTWSHLISLGFTWSEFVSFGFAWLHLIPLGFTSFHLVSLGFTWSHLVSLGFAWFPVVWL